MHNNGVSLVLELYWISCIFSLIMFISGWFDKWVTFARFKNLTVKVYGTCERNL